MTRALDQLAELVRQAEAKTLARRIESETQQSAERFRLAEQRSRRAVERHRTVRPAKLQSLEQTDIDEQLLKDLVRKLALYKSSLGSQADAEKLIAASQAEIERTRHENRAELEEISHELEEARRELRVAIDAYRQLRRELDRLQPELAAQFASADRLLWDAESYFPGGQLQLLAQEVEASISGYASLSKLEQYARLKVWIGRFRFYQASQDREAELSDDLQALSHRVFHQLKWLSRQYEPGYIEAFRQDFSTDWAVYVKEAQEQLHQANEALRRVRDTDLHSHHDHEPGSEYIPTPPPGVFPRVLGLTHAPSISAVSIAPITAQNQTASASLAGLKTLVARMHLPEEGLDQFLTAVRKAIADVGPANPELLRLVLPYREYINDEEGLISLQRNLERAQPQKTGTQSCDAS
jgi:hypothetical protein